jgi:hypothetical protein
MILVIQCASGKRPGAGHLRTVAGAAVDFVANPDLAPAKAGHVYARPDDRSDQGVSWRQVLAQYNEGDRANRYGLYPAYQLYENPVYERLVERFGAEKVFILSAGWGLIPAYFLTPYYDITFSPSAETYKRRRKEDRYQDFSLLPVTMTDPILFFGGKDYLPLFCSLTRSCRGEKTIFYNSALRPDALGCNLKRYETRTRTNWHYECANAFLDGRFRV